MRESRITRVGLGIWTTLILLFLFVPIVIIVVYDAVNQSSNLPFGAAFAVVPVLVMGVYLVIARRLGAFDAL